MIPRHSGHVQILDADGIKPTHQVRTQFVQEILSPVRHLLMQSRNFVANLRSILRPFCRLGESPLEDLQAIPFGFHPLGRPPLFPGRKPPEVVESEIAPYGTVPCVCYGVRDWVFVLNEYRDKELAGGHATDGDGFHVAWTVPTESRANPSRLRNVEDAIRPRDLDALGLRGTLLAACGVNTRQAFLLAKKAWERFIPMPQRWLPGVGPPPATTAIPVGAR